MPPLAFKPDASFFEKIALGAVGAQAVAAYLEARGHRMAELENGSTDTKMWKEVKRKRVRIPDLVCVRCGRRVESRAKSNKPELAMSHSATDAERAWDFGMVDEDWIAFPVCYRTGEEKWTAGRLEQGISYWRSRDRIRWAAAGHIGFFRVADFRARPAVRSSTKGVTEGSETAIGWDAIFSTRAGIVTRVDPPVITVRRNGDGHPHTWSNPRRLPITVQQGDEVAEHQILASAVLPRSEGDLWCSGELPAGHIAALLRSPERTQRFTGMKLARLRAETEYRDEIARAGATPEEDIYVRLEAATYLVAVAGESADTCFRSYLQHAEDQVRLEAVVALAETRTDAAGQVLAGIEDDASAPYFLRSAAAWGLGRIGTDASAQRLIAAFADVNTAIREEALDAVTMLGSEPVPRLLREVFSNDGGVAAGAAEAIRRLRGIPQNAVAELVDRIRSGDPPVWAAWLLGSLPQPDAAAHLEMSRLQAEQPHVHFAVTVLTSFMQSWIARTWEPFPRPQDFSSPG